MSLLISKTLRRAQEYPSPTQHLWALDCTNSWYTVPWPGGCFAKKYMLTLTVLNLIFQSTPEWLREWYKLSLCRIFGETGTRTPMKWKSLSIWMILALGCLSRKELFLIRARLKRSIIIWKLTGRYLKLISESSSLNLKIFQKLGLTIFWSPCRLSKLQKSKRSLYPSLLLKSLLLHP